MTRDEITRMARDCGWVIYEDMPYMDVQAIQDALIERLERFFHAAYAAGAAAEREACAKVCESEGQRIDAGWSSCAAAIRARGKQ